MRAVLVGSGNADFSVRGAVIRGGAVHNGILYFSRFILRI